MATTSNQSYSDVFTYDRNSNRMSDVHTGPGDGATGTTTYLYNSDDELTSQTSTVGGTTAFTYDANGSELTQTNGSTTTAYSYDMRNKMVAVADNGINQATYIYDDAGNLVQETTGTGKT